ncbi:hypothetical protein [Pyrobaculum sp.]|uniref:hypothetical protein n=1 Tax=Pyrobaculum sp. TaxID=2004705 RepID=UPI003D10A23C
MLGLFSVAAAALSIYFALRGRPAESLAALTAASALAFTGLAAPAGAVCATWTTTTIGGATTAVCSDARVVYGLDPAAAAGAFLVLIAAVLLILTIFKQAAGEALAVQA